MHLSVKAPVQQKRKKKSVTILSYNSLNGPVTSLTAKRAKLTEGGEEWAARAGGQLEIGEVSEWTKVCSFSQGRAMFFKNLLNSMSW